MTSKKTPGRLRMISPEVAMKRLGLKHFLEEEDPAASLIRAAMALSENARPIAAPDPGGDEDHGQRTSICLKSRGFRGKSHGKSMFFEVIRSVFPLKTREIYVRWPWSTVPPST